MSAHGLALPRTTAAARCLAHRSIARHGIGDDWKTFTGRGGSCLACVLLMALCEFVVYHTPRASLILGVPRRCIEECSAGLRSVHAHAISQRRGLRSVSAKELYAIARAQSRNDSAFMYGGRFMRA